MRNYTDVAQPNKVFIIYTICQATLIDRRTIGIAFVGNIPQHWAAPRPVVHTDAAPAPNPHTNVGPSGA
jgi:hypothetical protein